jgi:hypothetical protein
MTVSPSGQLMCWMAMIEGETKNEAGMENVLMASSRLTSIEKSTSGAGSLE